MSITNDRCWICDRVDCKVNSAGAERDLAWGAFDAAKASGYLPEHQGLRDAAFASSSAVTAAERDCLKHKVNWRARALTAEARVRELEALRDGGKP